MELGKTGGGSSPVFGWLVKGLQFSFPIVAFGAVFKKLPDVCNPFSLRHIDSHGLRWGQDENSMVHVQQLWVQGREGSDGIIDGE